MKNNEYLKLIGYVLLTFVVVWILALISNKCFDIEINSDTAIISFIGIIATFIVVGNYSQVAEMRNQALEQTKNYNLKIEEFDSKLKEIDKLKESVEAKEKDINNLQIEFYESQVKIYMGFSTIYYSSKNFSTTFYLTIMILKLFKKIAYKSHYNSAISMLINCIGLIDENVFTRDKYEEINIIISEIEELRIYDKDILSNLRIEINKKKLEYGY